MNDNKIKVGYLVSYDYEYLKNSLPTVYKHADKIVLAVDKYNKTWSGNDVEIPDSFFSWIKEFDTEHKIDIYEDSFYDSDLSPMECETRERNMLSRYMGEGGWHIQIDVDEYFIDFESLVNYIKSINIKKKVNIYAEWITLFKQTQNHAFLIDNYEPFPTATNYPNYTHARNIEDIENIYTKFKVIHQSWGRSEADLVRKLNNWGHTSDFDIAAYLDLWRAINKQTYQYIKNFHPLSPPVWKELQCVEANDISQVIEKVKLQQEQKAIIKKKSILSFMRKKK